MTSEPSVLARCTGAAAVLAGMMLARPLCAAARGIEPVRLTWSRAPEAESCPDGPAMEADVARRLGTNPFRADAAGAIDVRVTLDQGVWSAAIEFRPSDGPPGSRSVTSTAPTCESLALAAGLAIALTIREQASAEPEPPPPAPTPAPCPPLPPPVVPREREHTTAFVAGTAAFGVLPRGAFGASVLGRVPVLSSLSISGSMTFLPEQRTRAAGGSYEFGATFGGLTPCFELLDGEGASGSVCASLLVGALHVVVLDATPVGPGARLWAAGALGVRFDWNPTDPVHVLLGADALAPIRRHDFVVERPAGTASVFEQPALGALLTLGVGLEP